MPNALKWILLYFLALVFSAIAEGIVAMRMMNDATYRIGNNDGTWRSLTSSDFAQEFISAMIYAVIFGVILVIPVVISTGFMMKALNASSLILDVIGTALCGVFVGIGTSFLIYLVIGGWGPPQLFGLLASGIGAAIGWGIVSDRRQIA